MCVDKHAQTAQNNKFAISLQHIKKEVSDAFDSLHAGKHEIFLQIDTLLWFSIGMVKHSQSSQSSENCKFAMSLQYLKVSYKLISTLCASKFLT